ncbi:MAG TPA: hypothetical protein VHE30_12565 [Polyangiaceae bacterium]|nr:hypothetical protein [Polyangiaceae bacterium]
MRAARVGGIFFLGVGLGSCGSDGTGSASTPSHCEVGGPPASIDVDVCKSIPAAETADAATSCATCCTGAGFPDSGFLGSDHCLCGTVPKGDGDTACASKTASADECSACCSGGYVGYVSGGGTCQCGPKKDAAVCACALSDAEPDTSCESCCLHHGYLGIEYIGIGQRECGCVGS